MRFLAPALLGALSLAGLVTAAPTAVASPAPQRIAVAPQRIAVAPQRIAATPQRIAVAPQRIAATPQRIAATRVTPAAFAGVAAPAAAPSDVPPVCSGPGPWEVHAKAVNLRSKPTTSSTVLGVLYPSQHFKVHSTTKGWVNLTDTSTGVRGWASATYVYRDGGLCLD